MLRANCKFVNILVSNLTKWIRRRLFESVKDDISNTWVNKLKDLVVQGDMLRVSLLQKADYIWKSFIFDMPKGVMKFMINSFTDTLPTKNKLSRWGKRMNTNCNMCAKKKHFNIF